MFGNEQHWCERGAKEKESLLFLSCNLPQPPSDFQPAPTWEAVTPDDNGKVFLHLRKHDLASAMAPKEFPIMPLFPSCRAGRCGSPNRSRTWMLCSRRFLLSATRPCAKLFSTFPDPSLQVTGGGGLSFYISIKCILLLEQWFSPRKHSHPVQRRASQMLPEPRGPSDSALGPKMSSENLSWYPRRRTAS